MAPGRDLPRGLPLPPAHLARRFRSATGESISRYLLRLRLGLALDRLAAGDRDLGALADELGFANHSHFTARFRSTFGITPSAFRSSLSTRSLEELRTFVTAPRRAAS
jgi:AraC-like DNA-binding protein